GRAVATAVGDTVFETTVSVSSSAYLGDHQVNKSVIVPGAHYVAMALAAVERMLHTGAAVLEDVIYRRPLQLLENESRPVQLVVTPGEKSSFRIFSRDGNDS